MAQITLKGNPINTVGELPAVGTKIPSFQLVSLTLSEVSQADYAGKRLVLNIFPSIDTGICAMSVRNFNREASSLTNTAVLCISADLPFAHGRFCGAEGLNDVVTLSTFRSESFGKDYGIQIIDGPLTGLLARAVIVTDPNGVILYTELVPEIAQEPDYAKALEVLL